VTERRRPGDRLAYVPRDEADAPPGSPDAAVRRDLRALYAAPSDPGYWDGFEARILAAVRGGAAVTGAVTGAMRAVPAAAVEWWHALARWARPALAAAGATLAVAGAALVQTRADDDAVRAHSAFRAVLGAPGDAPGDEPGEVGGDEGGATLDPFGGRPLPAPDPALARAADAFDAEPGDSAAQADARAARAAAELLGGGLVRRRPLPPELRLPTGPGGAFDPGSPARSLPR
jgi:hypothetical protein